MYNNVEEKTIDLVQLIISKLDLDDMKIVIWFGERTDDSDFSVNTCICNNMQKYKDIQCRLNIRDISHIPRYKIDYSKNINGFSIEYLDAIGVDINIYDYSTLLYIFGIVHELGHLSAFKRIRLSPRKTKMLFRSLNDMIAIVSDDVHDLYELRQNHVLKYAEVYANEFAYKNFPIIWNSIKNKYDYYFNKKENEK